MPRKLRFGVLGVARIATTKVIPAMQLGEFTEIAAIASRDLSKARAAAESLGISRAYGSYEELIEDPEIEAVYNPLPNHLHVPWTLRALEQGKHVLCEKPIALNVPECRQLIEAEKRSGCRVSEAFMVRSHPQWLRARDIVRSGELGDVRSIIGTFSYFNRDPKNVRNVAGWGGGALYDIGCYPVQTSRFILGEEPVRTLAVMERDPEFETDRLTSAVLEFPSAHSIFTCGTQLAPSQGVQILGTKARLIVHIPYNAPPDRACRISIDRTGDLSGTGIETFDVPVCNQYTLQGDEFARAVLDGTPVPTPLDDSLRNTATLEALFESARTWCWSKPERFVKPGYASM
jgi:predicted dehydrogenase